MRRRTSRAVSGAGSANKEGAAIVRNPNDGVRHPARLPADFRGFRCLSDPIARSLVPAGELPAVFLPPREKIGRNDPCLCGSGKKFKKCCLG